MQSFTFFKTTIKTLWVRQLRKEWEQANFLYFKKMMRMPLIDLLCSTSMLGKWQGRRKRVLSISKHLITHNRWEYVREVLYHEMAHQYVEEVLFVTDALPHGDLFKKVCLQHGIDSNATGDLHLWVSSKKKSASFRRTDKLMDTVYKLLSLANSPNEHEAHAAMIKARELLLKDNISILETGPTKNYTHKQIGTTGKTNPIKSIIASILTTFFFVEAIWGSDYDQHNDKEGKVLEIYGTPSNIEMAEYVHDFLCHATEQLWKQHKKKNSLCANKHRRTYIYGLLNGFYDKLDSQANQQKSKSLVWKADPGLTGYYRRRNPRIKTVRSSYSKTCSDVYHAGVKKGEGIVIHKGVAEKNDKKIRFLGFSQK